MQHFPIKRRKAWRQCSQGAQCIWASRCRYSTPALKLDNGANGRIREFNSLKSITKQANVSWASKSVVVDLRFERPESAQLNLTSQLLNHISKSYSSRTLKMEPAARPARHWRKMARHQPSRISTPLSWATSTFDTCTVQRNKCPPQQVMLAHMNTYDIIWGSRMQWSWTTGFMFRVALFWCALVWGDLGVLFNQGTYALLANLVKSPPKYLVSGQNGSLKPLQECVGSRRPCLTCQHHSNPYVIQLCLSSFAESAESLYAYYTCNGWMAGWREGWDGRGWEECHRCHGWSWMQACRHVSIWLHMVAHGCTWLWRAYPVFISQMFTAVSPFEEVLTVHSPSKQSLGRGRLQKSWCQMPNSEFCSGFKRLDNGQSVFMQRKDRDEVLATCSLSNSFMRWNSSLDRTTLSTSLKRLLRTSVLNGKSIHFVNCIVVPSNWQPAAFLKPLQPSSQDFLQACPQDHYYWIHWIQQ